MHKSQVKYYSRKEPNRVIDEEDETYDYDDDEPHYITYPVTNNRSKRPKIDHAERMRRAEQSKRDKIAHAKRAEEMQQLRLKIKKARARHRTQAKLKKLLVPILIFAALLIYACIKWL